MANTTSTAAAVQQSKLAALRAKAKQDWANRKTILESLGTLGAIGGAAAGVAFLTVAAAPAANAAIGAAIGYGAAKGWAYAVAKGWTSKLPAIHWPGAGTGITAPGTPQPAGLVQIPSTPLVVPSALTTAANALVTALGAMTPTQSGFPACLAFQQAWNSVSTSVPLATDGEYGPKTQAALQAIIAPATAPGNFFPQTGAQVPPPAQPAAAPTLNVDVYQAASALSSMASIGTGSQSVVSTFQTSYNAVPGVSPQLTVDGIYGPQTQAALQSVLDSGPGGTAPSNGIGPMATEPTFPQQASNLGQPSGGIAYNAANPMATGTTDGSTVATDPNAQYATTDDTTSTDTSGDDQNQSTAN